MCVPARPVEMREAGGSVERGLQRRQLSKQPRSKNVALRNTRSVH